MNPKFITLDCDDDVVMLEKDTFTLGRLKELSYQEIRKKLDYSTYDRNTRQAGNDIYSCFQEFFLAGQNIKFSEIQFNFIKDCQILKIGGKGWQKGKLRINICISTQGRNSDKVCLEFCPDEAIEHESPLDDIRKLVEKN